MPKALYPAAALQPNSQPNIIRNTNVKWDKYVLNNREDASKVVEFDIQPDSGLLALGKVASGYPVRYANKTCAVFIELNNGTRLNFFMKVIEDYTQTKQSVIGNLHYRQIPASFSGNVIFFSLDKKFINGYKYLNGKVVGTLGNLQVPYTAQQINSVKSTNKVAAYICEIDDYYYWECDNSGCYFDPDPIDEEYVYCTYDDGGSPQGPVTGDTGGSGGGTPGGGGGNTPSLDPNNILYNGSKPLAESPNRCAGLANLWTSAVNAGVEEAGLVTADGQFISILGRNATATSVEFSGLYNYGPTQTVYYTYPDSQGPPTQTYAGMVHSAGQYWIPVVAAVHTHNQCVVDGSDGVTNNTASQDAPGAGQYPLLKFYVIGCNAVGSYNQYSTSYQIVSTSALLTSCSLVQ